MMNVRLLWGGTLKIVKPLAFERVQSFCHSFWRNDGKYQKSATVFDGVSKSNLGKDITNDQAIITPVNKDSHKLDSNEQKIAILSFDGGGSRGVMEVKILDDVLRFATIVLNNPETVNYLVNKRNDKKEVNFLENRKVRDHLINDINKVEDPIHPTDVYDMIVGTSTGGLIAFGLVGGNKVGKKHHKRERMTLDECIQMYCKKCREIFRKSFFHWFYSHMPLLSKIPLVPYSQDNFKKALEDQFGDCILKDFAKNKGPIVGAVARRYEQKKEGIVLFDTADEKCCYRNVCQVLLATSNAPIYFEIPVKVGEDKYIDGGVGGNCPLGQAIPQARKLFKQNSESATITSALSIAPPSSNEWETCGVFKFIKKLGFLAKVSTNGNVLFETIVENNQQNDTLFQRLSPRGESLKSFKLDEINAQKMVDAMEKVKAEDDMYLVDVVATAMVVVFTSFEKGENKQKTSSKLAVQLANAAGRAYESKNEYELAINSYQISKRLHKNAGSDKFTLFEIDYDIAKCQKKNGDYVEAINSFMSNVDNLVDQNNDDQKYDDLIVDNLIEKLHCHLQTLQYQNAEKCLNKISHYEIRDEKRVQVLIYKAWYSRQQGKLEETFNLYRDAAKITLDNNNFDKAEILNNMGLLFIDLGMKDEAFDFIQQAQHVRVKLIGQKDDDLLLAESHKNVGLCLVEKGDGKNAKKELQKAIEIYKKIGDEIKISNVLQMLARCMLLQDHQNYTHALNYAKEAQEKMEQQVDKKFSPEIAKIRSIFGKCLLETGSVPEAKENLEKASRLIEDWVSKDHPQLMEIYQLLSQLYAKEGKPKLAVKYKNKKTSIRNKIEKIASIVQNSGEFLTWKKQ
ncbi:uncharacterized protein LOC124434846 isoform X2 [Xenia sp. Carnegie-2017]|uniref:uncharacterized protein LOC124434846 isoform X2 n=1 Tax=Xenia sp. Carnegie-2017 TaxID=2897299 RepID=UPI001F03A2C3|nr:uncharacterized protein LOC124434846 isoform X2 [Xenia sp. Carnegie-2017]